MNNALIWTILGVVSILLGFFDHISVSNLNGKVRRSFEVWRHSIGYFFSGIIGYYFIAIRWPIVKQGSNLSTSDFILGAVFIMSVLGWLPYFVKYMTEELPKKIIEKLNK